MCFDFNFLYACQKKVPHFFIRSYDEKYLDFCRFLDIMTSTAINKVVLLSLWCADLESFRYTPETFQQGHVVLFSICVDPP